MRILAVSGSLRRGSHNTALLRAAASLLPPGVELVHYRGLREIPPYDDDDHHIPPSSVQCLRDELNEADAVLVATPEYNCSIPGQLKNALDWMSRPLATSPLRNKPVAVIGASTSMFGAVWAQAETRKVLSAITARVLDRELAVPNAEAQFDAGRLVDPEIENEFGSLLEELAESVRERERATA